MRYLDSINDVLNKILLVLCGVAVLALMILATGNVLLRIFHIPFGGTYEIVAFLGAVVTAFALGYTQKRRDHIIVDILTERFPKDVQMTIDKFADLCMMVFFGVVAWQLYVWGVTIVESNEVSETLKVIYYPFVFAVALGFAVLSLTTFVDFLKKLFRVEE